MYHKLSGTSTQRTEQITRWLIILFTVLILGVLWALFLASSFNERDQIRGKEQEQLTRSVQLLASQTASIFDRARTAMDVLSRWIAYSPGVDPLRSDEFRSLANVFSSSSSQEFDLRFVDREGGLYYLKQPSEKALANVGDRDYYKVQVQNPPHGFFIDRPVKSRVTQLWGIPISIPLAPNSSGFSVMFAALELQSIEALLKSHQSDPDVSISLVRNDGLIMTRYPFKEDLVGVIPPADPIWEGQIRKNPEQGLLTYHSRITDNQVKMIAYQRVPGHPLYAIISRTDSVLDAAWQQSFGTLLFYMAGFSTLIVAIAVMLLVFHFRLRAIRLQLEDLSRTDPLTGLMNRRSFFERGSIELLRCQRFPQALCVWMLDLDHFKSVNDRFGHQAGDTALKSLADVLRQNVRATDFIARLGGEEFAVIMVPSTLDQALEVAERARLAVASIGLPEGNLATSIGLASWNGTEGLEDLMKRADAALYEAKNLGRNRVVLAREDRLVKQ